MRLSEKTIELNFCSQFSQMAHRQIIWFGLTQKQEAKWGFDACTRLSGKLIIFQFKASSKIVRKARRFYAKHQQLQNLKTQCRGARRSVFYVFPSIGTTNELASNSNFISNSQLLDVTDISHLSAPTKRDGTLRKSDLHHIDVYTGKAIIHSEPVEVPLIQTAGFASDGLGNIDKLYFQQSFNEFFDFISNMERKAVGGVILNR